MMISASCSSHLFRLFSRILSTTIVLVFLGLIVGCQDEPSSTTPAGDGSNARQDASTPDSAASKLGSVQVELAPFDRFPINDKFPLVFRFASAVAPANRRNSANFETITLSPVRPGTWRWESDSELHFVPLDPWKQGDQFGLSLKGLVTSDGSARGGPVPSPASFKISLPKPGVALERCELVVKNTAPLIQAPSFALRFNYAAEKIQDYWELKLRRGNSEEALDLSSPRWVNEGTSASTEGPKIFRPESVGTLHFKLKPGLPLARGGALEKGIECDIPLDPKTWDEVAERNRQKVSAPELAELDVNKLVRTVSAEGENKESLRVKFHAPWSTKPVEHGKAKGITIENGIELSPPIEGIWKTDDYDAAAIFFTPKNDWPVGIDTILRVDPAIFPAVQLRSLEVKFKTPELLTQIENPTLYLDPLTPSKRKVVGEVRFSHVPKAGEVERLLSLTMRIEPEKTFTSKLGFTATIDPKNSRLIHFVSSEIDIPAEPGEVRIEFSPGAISGFGGSPSSIYNSSVVPVPSRKDIFKIKSASVSVLRTESDGLKRVLVIETSEPVPEQSLLSALEFSLIPDCKLEGNKKLCGENSSFATESRIVPEVISKSEKVAVVSLSRSEAQLPNVFNFSFESPGKREMFLNVKHGLESSSGFSLANDFRQVFFVEEFSRELKIMHSGALLSLSGDKKLGVMLRNIEEVTFDLARVLPANVHHLVSATSGQFDRPYFNYNNFGIDQLAEHFIYSARFNGGVPGEATYTTVDFDRFAARNALPRGLFLLTIKQKIDPKKLEAEREEYSECTAEAGDYYEGEERSQCVYPNELEDRRLVLLTDLGLIVKDSISGSHDVFAMSFRSGAPVVGATIKLLGQNGIPLFTAITNGDGRVSFPSTKDLKAEKLPLLYVVEQNGDYAFLPFKRYDRQLNFSRFDTNGVMEREEAEGLRALLFSDRGIYRPGEEARFGIMVRKRNLEQAPDDLPLELVLSDPRGIEILKRKFRISSLGFDDFRWSSEGALSGSYNLSIMLVRDDKLKRRSVLGSTSFRVEDFQPDKLAVKARYSAGTASVLPGWAGKSGTFDVNVQNLFGTAAVDNKVTGTLKISPWEGEFAEYPDYQFYTRPNSTDFHDQSENLGDLKTDSNGDVHFVPDLSKYSESALELRFAAEAYEKESGRSVISTANALVSDARLFLGWKADGNLNYISVGGGRKISLIGVGADLKRLNIGQVRTELEETRMISTLVKQPNGTFGYELTPKKSIVKTDKISITESGYELLLDTSKPGDFRLSFFDSSGVELNSLHYLVHGEGNSTFTADRKAEVGLMLAKSSVLPGEELELSINVPYEGAGIITIERDKVYATKWFKSSTLSSIQKITVPNEIVGNAYVSVAFVRSLSSREIYSSPLSYAVKPFTIAPSRYTESIKLEVPEKVKPGNNISVRYSLGDPAKLVLYAVDEGILQFARYKNPDPVRSFMPKRALEVETFQILDLLLPDQRIVSSLSSPGGDEDVGLGKFKNPFARKRRAPMAFWSGIVGADSKSGTVDIPVPEYFNGTVRIVAVAVSSSKVGVQSTSCVAQHDFVIDPQVPYFVAPGDEFEIGATVANVLKGSGANQKLKLELSPSTAFEAISNLTTELEVPEGQDRVFRMRLRAREMLGDQQVKFKASSEGHEASMTESVSVRPPGVKRTTLQVGMYRPDKEGENAEKQLTTRRVLFDEHRDVVASISEAPISVGRALMEYLKSYPYGCTEQLVSIAFPAVLFGTNSELGLSESDVQKFTNRAFKILQTRQKADGSFGLWDVASEADPLFSVYATHFLLEARKRSLDVSQATLENAKRWLKNYGAETKYTHYEQLAQAYALYVRALGGEVVANEAKTLVSELDRQWATKWRGVATALFLSGTFKLLQMDTEADALLVRPPEIWRTSVEGLAGDPSFFGAVYSLISNNHFGAEKALSPLDTVLPVARMIDARNFYSFTSTFAILGLRAFGERVAASQKGKLAIAGENPAGQFTSLPLTGREILNALIPQAVKKLQFNGEAGKMFFYQLSETGYDREAAKSVTSGLTVQRELKNGKGEIKKDFTLEDKIDATIFIKAESQLSRVAVVELIPGGFEIDLSGDGLANRKSLTQGPNTWSPSFIEVQEDRVIFFGDLPADTVTFTYRLKPLSKGKFTTPAPYAEAMYDTTKYFLGAPDNIEIH